MSEKEKNWKEKNKKSNAKKNLADRKGIDGTEPKQTFLQWLYKLSIEYFVNWKSHLKEYLIVIAIMLVFRSLVGVVYRIPTVSMVPTFKVGDTLVANRFFYGLKLPFTDELEGFRLPAIKEVQKGDLIIFRAPEERLHYSGKLDFNLDDTRQLDELIIFLKKLNEDSSKYRSLGPIEKDHFFYQSLGAVNYIFAYYDSAGGMLRLNEEVYQKHKSELERRGFQLENTSYGLMTYANSEYDGLFFSMLKTPMAGVSIIVQAVVDTPYFLASKIMIRGFAGDMENGIIGEDLRFKVYPNVFLDRTKEFVKRVVATSGDKVEINNKRLYVNDVFQEWTGDVLTDSEDDSFVFLEEQIGNGAEGTVFTHPLRVSRTSLKPIFDFDSNLWPYEPDSVMAINFRDNFGPIYVKENHFFALGDNRDESQDSRYFGEVPAWAIKGTPMAIFFPFDRAGKVR